MNKLRKPQQTVAREQRGIVCWSIMHVITTVCLIAGMYFSREYMLLPDRAIIVDNAGNIYYGSSCAVVSEVVAKDIAIRATMAFLERSFEHDSHAAREALFGRSAQKSLRSIIQASRDEFNEQKIRQVPVVEEVELSGAGNSNQCLVFVRGTLHRTGTYMNLSYYRQLEFTLGLRLMRSPDINSYPLRVLRMRYEEKSIFNNHKKGI
ncbi:MAG: hypothetical protein JXR78_14925 [Victivallales bacterium]|nr:hypothetical protein [Victivallales bacterium]